jgi:hypothetical protein
MNYLLVAENKQGTGSPVPCLFSATLRDFFSKTKASYHKFSNLLFPERLIYGSEQTPFSMRRLPSSEES